MSKMLSALVLASTAVLAAVPAALAGDGIATLQPRQGVTLDLGSKRSVGYFLTDAQTCQLTVLLAEAMIDGIEEITAPARLQFAVGAGNEVRVDTADGKAVGFACAADARSMTVSRRGDMAAYKKG